MVGALVTNVTGSRAYLVGASTITQQLARNFFLTEEMAEEQQTRQRSLRRKLLEQFMAVILETKATKDEILELYLNDVYLGHRGSFALHGVAEAARIFFGKDVTNLTLAEAALIAGVIQSPYNHSPFTSWTAPRSGAMWCCARWPTPSYISPDAADARRRRAHRRGGPRASTTRRRTSSTTCGRCSTRRCPGVTARPARSTSTRRWT